MTTTPSTERDPPAASDRDLSLEELVKENVPRRLRMLSPGMRLRCRLENWAVAGLEHAAALLPAASLSQLGARLGGVAYRLDRERRELGFRNLELAFGAELTEERRRDIVRCYYQNLGRTLMETLVLRRRSREEIRARVEVEGLEIGKAALEEHGAALFVTCHGGPYELLPVVAQDITELYSVFRPLRNPYLNLRALRTRQHFGSRLIRRRGALKSMVGLLKEGRSLGLVSDLNERRNPAQIAFFGAAAPTLKVPGWLATRLKKPVVPAFCARTERPFHYRAYLEPAILPERGLSEEANVEGILIRANQAIERYVRRHVDQWQWNYPRWGSSGATAGGGRIAD